MVVCKGKRAQTQHRRGGSGRSPSNARTPSRAPACKRNNSYRVTGSVKGWELRGDNEVVKKEVSFCPTRPLSDEVCKRKRFIVDY